MSIFGKSAGIRSNLVRSILLGVGLLILAMVVVLDFSMRAFLFARDDADLMHRAQALMSLVKEDEDGIEFDYIGGMIPEFEAPDGSEFFEIWLPEDRLLARSNSLVDRALPLPHFAVEKASFAQVELEDVGSCRLLHLSFFPLREEEDDEDPEGNETIDREEGGEAEGPEDPGDSNDLEEDEADIETITTSDVRVTLVLLRKRDRFHQFLSQIRLLIYGIGGGVLILLIFLVQSSLKKGLHPLEDIRKQVMTIQPHLLETRIRLEKPVAELEPVVEQLNALLTRLEDAVHREKRFTSDVAHELRTPLAELRTLAEVSVQDLGDRKSVNQFFSDVREISLEMQALVTQLLELARCESGSQVMKFDKVDFGSLTQRVRNRLLENLPQSEFANLTPEGALFFVCSDEAWLDLILQNIFKNAVAHRSNKGKIVMNLQHFKGLVIFNLSNPTETLEEADLSHLFDRFWQKDSARTGGKNTGLGLSLVKSFCERLGIEVRASLDQKILTMTLVLPMYPHDQVGPEDSLSQHI